MSGFEATKCQTCGVLLSLHTLPERARCDRRAGPVAPQDRAAELLDEVRALRAENAAVARERREAAAEALEEAGDFALSAHYGPPIRMIGSLDDGTENRRLLRDWLRTRAAALRMEPS